MLGGLTKEEVDEFLEDPPTFIPLFKIHARMSWRIHFPKTSQMLAVSGDQLDKGRSGAKRTG